MEEGKNNTTEIERRANTEVINKTNSIEYERSTIKKVILNISKLFLLF